MPDYRVKLPAIKWGTAYANLLSVGYRLDNVRAGPQPRAGSAFDQAPSGIEDAWRTGIDYYLSFELRWIPQTDTASPTATGWDGATGVAEFLNWARDKNVIRFLPDAGVAGTFIDSYLVEPMQGYGEPEVDGTRRLACVIRNSATRYDGY